MRANHLIKEKKKKPRHMLGGFPVVTLLVGHGDADAGGDGAVEEALGRSDAELTDHTFDEAEAYIKQNYPLHKTFTIRRMDPGFRMDQPDGVKQVIKSITQSKGVDAALAQLGMKQNNMMSGSAQPTTSIGWSWNTLENSQHGIAVLYYQDRGTGADAITIAAKENNNLLGAVNVFREAGVLPTAVDLKQRQAQRTANRQALLQKKGFAVGTKLNLTDHYQTYNRVEGQIAEITPAGKLKIKITQAEVKPEQKKIAAVVKPGDTVTMAANYISKKNVIVEFAPPGGGDNREPVFVLAPRIADRKKFKIQITDATHEEFQQVWNQLPDIFHKFFDNVYPFWNAMHPLFSKLPVKKYTIQGYVALVSSAFLEFMSANAKAGKSVTDYGPSRDLTESSGDFRTASEIANELYKEIDDLSHALASGSTQGAGNPHHIASLKTSIIQLYKDLSDLGYEYDPTQPNYIRSIGSRGGANVRRFRRPKETAGQVFVIRHSDGEPIARFNNREDALDYFNSLKQSFPNNDYTIKQEKDPGTMYEEIKLSAPHKKVDRKELQSYLDRVKTSTKTKKDKFAPIIHGSNIKAITKSDDPDDRWDLDDLANQITTRPKALLGTNAKMAKSKTEGEIIYDLTLPALSGIVVDEGTGDFVEITTCPGAGECQLFCYARKGGYIMFPASSMSAAQALNYLVNDPKGYSDMVNREIKAIKSKTDKAGIQLVVRWHDAGDFFSKEYLDLAFDVARGNPDVQFYAYTKMGDVATAQTPNNFIINFSSGSKRREEKKIEIHRANTRQEVKAGITVPKDMFYDLIDRDGIKLNKDAKGRTQFKSPEALEMFKDRLAAAYKVNPDTIITYDQMLDTPIGSKPHWNVIVQPGAGDRAANRRDVINSFLMFH